MMRDVQLLFLFVCVSTIIEPSLEIKSTFKNETVPVTTRRPIKEPMQAINVTVRATTRITTAASIEPQSEESSSGAKTTSPTVAVTKADNVNITVVKEGKVLQPKPQEQTSNRTESKQSNESSNTQNKIPKQTVHGLFPSKGNQIRNSTNSTTNGSTKSSKQGVMNPNKLTSEQDGQPAQAPPKPPTPPKDMNDAREKVKQAAEQASEEAARQAAQFKNKIKNLHDTGWSVIKWPFIVAIGSLVDDKNDAFSLKEMLQKANENGKSYKEQIEIFRSAIMLMDVRNKVHSSQPQLEKGKLFKTLNRFTKMFALDMQLYTKQATASGPNSYYNKTIKSDYFMDHYNAFYNALKKFTVDRLKEQVPGLSKMG